MKINFLYILIILPLFSFSQNDYESYKKELIKLDLLSDYFKNQDDFSNSTYLRYLQDNNLIELGTVTTRTDTIGFNSTESGYIFTPKKKDRILSKRIGIWTYKNKNGNITYYAFYASSGFAKGPNWWYRGDGTIKEKRFWDQSSNSKVSKDRDVIISKEYYSIKFRKNGTKKREGLYLNGNKKGIWKMYNNKGKITKEIKY